MFENDEDLNFLLIDGKYDPVFKSEQSTLLFINTWSTCILKQIKDEDISHRCPSWFKIKLSKTVLKRQCCQQSDIFIYLNKTSDWRVH